MDVMYCYVLPEVQVFEKFKIPNESDRQYLSASI